MYIYVYIYIHINLELTERKRWNDFRRSNNEKFYNFLK